MMKYQIYKDIADEYRWRLKSPNGKIVAVSGEGYANETNCREGIRLATLTNDKTDIQVLSSDPEPELSNILAQAAEGMPDAPLTADSEEFREAAKVTIALIQSHLEGQPLSAAGPTASSSVLKVLTVIGLINALRK